MAQAHQSLRLKKRQTPTWQDRGGFRPFHPQGRAAHLAEHRMAVGCALHPSRSAISTALPAKRHGSGEFPAEQPLPAPTPKVVSSPGCASPGTPRTCAELVSKEDRCSHLLATFSNPSPPRALTHCFAQKGFCSKTELISRSGSNVWSLFQNTSFRSFPTLATSRHRRADLITPELQAWCLSERWDSDSFSRYLLSAREVSLQS